MKKLIRKRISHVGRYATSGGPFGQARDEKNSCAKNAEIASAKNGDRPLTGENRPPARGHMTALRHERPIQRALRLAAGRPPYKNRPIATPLAGRPGSYDGACAAHSSSRPPPAVSLCSRVASYARRLSTAQPPWQSTRSTPCTDHSSA